MGFRRGLPSGLPPLNFESSSMSEFQVLAIPICFVLGAGIIKILDGAGATIRRRKQAGLVAAHLDIRHPDCVGQCGHRVF